MDWSWGTFALVIVTALVAGSLGFLTAACLVVGGRADAIAEARRLEREACLAMMLEALDRVGAASLAVQEAQKATLARTEARP